MECRICGSSGNFASYHVKEHMFGLDEVFHYFQCEKCGCLQIANLPSNMDKYYPGGYYSYDISLLPETMLYKFKSIIKKIIVMSSLGRFTYFSGLIGPPLRAVALLRPTQSSRILDIGCGAGSLLRDLHAMGFKNILGVDPYVADDIDYGQGLKVIKDSLDNVEGKWDIVMFHHSFEHIFEQQKTLKSVSRLLEHGGICLIRIPTVSSYVWRQYKENWVQIDAPRHFYLHSKKSMEMLAAQTGFSVKTVHYDSTEFQFWGSELYANDITLTSPNQDAVEKRDLFFSKKKIKQYSRQAKQLNAANDGDQAAFILMKS